MISIRKILSKLTGHGYHYRIRMEYRDRFNHSVGYINITVIVADPSDIEQHRKIKQALAQELLKGIPKFRLSNGVILVEPLCYLGWLKEERRGRS